MAKPTFTRAALSIPSPVTLATPRVLPDLTADPNAGLKAELERLRAENASLKSGPTRRLTMRVAPKGGMSLYGMGQYPVTLYKTQWYALLDAADEIRAFIQTNDHALKNKGE